MIKITKDEILHKGFFDFKRLHLKNGDAKYTRDYVERNEAVAAIVFDPTKNNFLFTKQYRVGCKKEIVEIVAGIIEDLTPDETITKEVLEELGYEVEFSQEIMNFYTSPGFSDEKMYLYYIEVGDKVSDGGGCDDEHEYIETIEMAQEEIDFFDFEDGKTILALGLMGLI